MFGVMKSTQAVVLSAQALRVPVPSFNIPYLPIMEPVVRALRDMDSFGLIAVARPEWEKFEARSLQAVSAEYEKRKLPRHTRLHLDHTPVIDEDRKQVDYLAIIKDALAAGYQSVMVDGSRLPLPWNIEATRTVVDMAHAKGVAVEGELGAVMGHEAGPLPPYEELFRSGKGFTDPAEAVRFVKETGVDWLSVAIGNIHGAISGAAKSSKKVEARLNIEHLRKIRDLAHVPLVLHGGSGINTACLKEAFWNGIVRINVGTSIRQPYEQFKDKSIPKAQQAVYEEMVRLIREELGTEGTAAKLGSDAD